MRSPRTQCAFREHTRALRQRCHKQDTAVRDRSLGPGLGRSAQTQPRRAARPSSGEHSRRLRGRGAGVRGRQPEGRRRQDHDDPHPRAWRSPISASGCCSSTSIRRRASPSRSVSTPSSARRPSHDVLLRRGEGRRRGRRRRPASGCCPPTSTSPAPRCTCSRAPAASTRSRARSTPCARRTTSCSSTARRRSACSRSTGSPPPTRCSCPLQCETLSHRGVGQLLDTIADVRAFTKPDLQRARRGRDDVRRARPPRARGARRRADALRAHGARPADPEDGPLRRSARTRRVDPRARAELARARRPTARSRPRCTRTSPTEVAVMSGVPARRRRATRAAGTRSARQGRAVLRPCAARARSWSSAGTCGESHADVLPRVRARQPAVLGVAAAAAAAHVQPAHDLPGVRGVDVGARPLARR